MARRIDRSKALGVNACTLPLLGESYAVKGEIRGSTRLLGRERLEIEQL